MPKLKVVASTRIWEAKNPNQPDFPMWHPIGGSEYVIGYLDIPDGEVPQLAQIAEFVEKSSFVRALEMTTDEIKFNHDIFLVNKNIFSDWIILLEKADLIKYAKQPASISEMEKDKKKALGIIENIFIKE